MVEDDPYTFYTLEKIDSDGKRCWKMECRLYELCKVLSRNIREYCTTLFRKIYLDIYSDNVYREDYINTCPITDQDCNPSQQD